MDADTLGEYIGAAITYGVAAGFLFKLLRITNGRG